MGEGGKKSAKKGHFFQLDKFNWFLSIFIQSGLKSEMDDNRNSSNKRINDLNEKLSNLLKTSKDGINELSTLLQSESKTLRSLMGQPLSVFFDAYRSVWSHGNRT